MTDNLVIGLATIIFAGIFAQWLAWRIRIPSILLLLVFGLLIGPILGFINPDELFGDLLFPLVSLAVGIILFEGGLGLRLRDLPGIKHVVRNLISIGALVTWAVGAAAAYFIIGLDLSLSLIRGAILIVSGPTVILPLLRDVRPEGQVGSILRWEGILIDPVGATLALLVFETVLQTNLRSATGEALINLLQIVIIGAALGWAGARILSLLLKRYLIPDHLQNTFTLMAVIGIFGLSNVLASESGLLATTIMGMVLANQNAVSIKRIIEFKEDLGVLLTSSIFVLLAARLQIGDILSLGWPALVFLAAIILLARPLNVLISTLGAPLQGKEKAFLAWMAPRGIVAAAVASIFAIELAHLGYPNADKLVSLTFLVIIGTVVVYGLTAGPLARRLGLAEANPQGLLFVGAHKESRNLAKALKDAGIKIVLVDTNARNVSLAEDEGLRAYCGNVLYEDFIEEINLGGVGRMLALTSNDEINTLASLHMAEIFGRSNVYQLPLRSNSASSHESVPDYLVGRLLFGPDITYRVLSDRFDAGWTLHIIELTNEFDYAAFSEACADYATPMFAIRSDGTLVVLAATAAYAPHTGDKLIALVAPSHTVEAPPPDTEEEALMEEPASESMTNHSEET